MANGSMETKGFFAALFDFGFTSFVTLRFLKVIYAILVCVILLFGLIFLIGGLAAGGGELVLAIILAPTITLLYLIFTRVYMEIIALFFRIGENTSIMAAHLSGGAPPATGYGGFGAPGGGTPPSTPPSAPPYPASPTI
jgi:Domain of unknown function (DUF4282)